MKLGGRKRTSHTRSEPERELVSVASLGCLAEEAYRAWLEPLWRGREEGKGQGCVRGF